MAPPGQLVAASRRLWAPVFISVLLLGPVLLVPGYLLTYDMVWVPDLALRTDFLGLGSGIPRAVPSDAWVAVLDEVIPGMLLQKLVLFGSLVAGGVGIQRWMDDTRVTFGSTAAAVFYLWNPYVVERLAIGHWPMLVCYGLLPWVARAVVDSVRSGRVQPSLLLLLPLASLNASAGIAVAVVVLAFAAGRGGTAVLIRLGATVLVANLPWIAAGLAKAGVLRGVDGAAEVFAPAGEGRLPAPLATLALGGIWNAEVVPASRTTLLAWVAVVLLVVSLVVGWRALRRSEIRGWWICAAVGWSLALLGWAAPVAIDHLADLVPGAGVLRDGSRLLLLLAPLLAIALGATTDRLVAWAGESGPVIGAFLVLLPIGILPDAAWGMTGDLEPVDHPESFAAMRVAVAEVHRGGDVLVLPFTAYRAPEWNGYRKVFDPVGRYQDENYLSSDALSVSGEDLGGEDPRGRAVMAALAEDTPQDRSRRLAELGIGVVVTDSETAALPGQEAYVAEVAGAASTPVAGFEVTALADPAAVRPGRAEVLGLGLAWLVYLGQVLAGLVGSVIGVARMRRTAGSSATLGDETLGGT